MNARTRTITRRVRHGLELVLLTLVLLKLTHVIRWSWWLVVAPLWLPVAAVALGALGLAAMAGLGWLRRRFGLD